MSINLKLFVIGIIIFVVGSFLRLAPNENLKNIDELFPSYVTKGMNLRGDVNTDWRLAVPELPYDLGRFRYNFSSYILFTKLSLTKIAVNKDALKYIRLLNIPLFFLSFIGLYLLSRELKIGYVISLFIVAMYSFSPGAIHDAQMARPETFMTAILIFYFYFMAAYMRLRHLSILFTAGIMLGLLVATKFTLIVFGVSLPFVLFFSGQELFIKKIGLQLLLFAAAFCSGFLLGAPYVASDFWGYLDGIKELMLEYHLHPPHSHIDGGNTFIMQAEFYLKVYGFAFLSTFAILVMYFYKQVSKLTVIYASNSILFFFLIGFAGVFFERNLTPVMPIYFLMSGVLINSIKNLRYAQIFFGLLFILPLFYWTLNIWHVQTKQYTADIDKFEFEITQNIHPKKIEHKAMIGDPSSCGLVRFIDYSDPWSENSRIDYLANGWLLLAKRISPFTALPTSTLHTYLAADIYWFMKKC